MANQVTFKTINWAQLVSQVLGEELAKRDVVYEFSDGRKFEESGPEGAFYERS